MAPGIRRVCWIDGRLAPMEEAVVCADDSAFAEGRGCFTSVRIAAGRPRFADRHARRLQRGARELRIGALEAAQVKRALAELAEAALPSGEGVVRLQVSRDGRGTHLVGIPRALGEERGSWRALLAPLPHPGATPHAGHKLTARPTLALVAERAAGAGADEALLLDRDGWLVEGTRTSVFAALARGPLATPPLARGGVWGIAREVVLERVPEAVERDVSRAELVAAHEIVAVNAVRGARPITELDGAPVGDGRPGRWAARLADVLARD